MPYVLKYKTGKDAGKYRGRSRPQSDINKARVFGTISGVKTHYGYPMTEENRKLYIMECKRIPYREHQSWSERQRIRNEIAKKYMIPIEERYEVIELKLTAA